MFHIKFILWQKNYVRNGIYSTFLFSIESYIHIYYIIINSGKQVEIIEYRKDLGLKDKCI